MMAAAIEMGIRFSRRGWSWVRDERYRLRRNALLALAVLTALPSQGFDIYVCPFHVLTGYICPVCGLTRSLSSLFHGELWQSLQYHPLGIVVAMYLFSLVVTNQNPAGYLPPTLSRHSRRMVGMLIVVILGTWVLRLALLPHLSATESGI